MTGEEETATAYAFDALRNRYPEIPVRLQQQCQELAAMGATGKAVATRLHLVGEHIAQFTPSAISSYIDPVGASAAIEREKSARIPLLALIRNIGVLLPLVFTWSGLFWVATQYQAYSTTHQNDGNQSLLLLWQQGFGTGNTILSLANFAAIDVMLFAALIIMGIVIDQRARRARSQAFVARQSIEAAVTDLIQVLFSVSIDPLDPQGWSREANQVLLESTTIIERLAQLGKSSAAVADASHAQLATLAASTKVMSQMLQELTDTVAVLAAAVKHLPPSSATDTKA